MIILSQLSHQVHLDLDLGLRSKICISIPATLIIGLKRFVTSN